MSKISFRSNHRPTIGIELELALVDADTMLLRNSAQDLIARLPEGSRTDVKHELMQSAVEIVTGVCTTVDEAGQDLTLKLSQVERAAAGLGLGLFWGGTHPFASWRDQRVTPDPRYETLVDLLQEMARRLITFGLHVHVGVDSGDKAVMICDRILQHLPTLLALSCSSPYWEGRDTGLHSHRSKVMEGLPTAGLPPLMSNWSEYVWLVNHLVDTGFINTIREIWWDVRPHHDFGTVEIRVCDMPGDLSDALAIAALCQCLVTALSDEIDEGTYQYDCHPMLVRQNKWRACRFGTRAHLVDAYTHQVNSLPQIVDNLLAHLAEHGERNDCREYLEHVRVIANRPSWADRQRDILASSGTPEDIVRQLTRLSRAGNVDR